MGDKVIPPTTTSQMGDKVVPPTTISKMGDIADVCDWKVTDNDVEIKVKPASRKDLVVKIEMNKESKLDIIKISETNLEIVVKKQQPQQGGSDSTPATQGGEVSNMQSTDPNAPKKPTGGDRSEKKPTGGDQSENPWRKQSENVLGNVMNLLKEYKGVVITAVIAISLGFLLRRKFKAV